jgi:hypothetical protein
MTLWHRAPREVYRVYGQDEYLAEDDLQVGEAFSAPPAGEEARGSRSGRLVGLGVLVGVTVGALGLVVLNVWHQRSAAPRSVVAQSARARAAGHSSAASRVSTASRASTASHVSVRVPTGAEPATHTSTRPASHVSASVRPPARPLVRSPSRGGTPTRPVSNAVSVGPWRGRLSTSELPASDAGPPTIDGEFDFER